MTDICGHCLELRETCDRCGGCDEVCKCPQKPTIPHPHRIIIAIDDDPDRYCHLRQLAPWVVVTTFDRHEVEQYLNDYRVVGVCLDHDMPRENGVWFAEEFLCELSIPVAITSANEPGARNIHYKLNEYEVPNKILSCTQHGWEQQVLKFFNEHHKE